MIRHYLKLAWNRRRANGLILVEILVSFLVLCGVFCVASYYAANWSRPRGFDYRNVWTLEVEMPRSVFHGGEAAAAAFAVSRRLIGAIRAHPGVEVVAPMPNTPYSGNLSSQGLRQADGALVQFMMSRTTADGLAALRLDLLEGRWIEPGDDAMEFTPCVISRSLGRRLFGNESPVGKTIEGYGDDGKLEAPKKSWQVRRVVGVIRDYQKAGEFADTRYASFQPQTLSDPDRGWVPWSYVIRVSPRTPAVFEEQLLKVLHAEAPDWTVTMRSLEVERQRYLRGRLLPLGFGVLLAGFLVLMVGMGLTGVLWQNVTRRTQEMGLRRALGATAGGVRNQILGEILVVTAIALTLGVALLLQLPLLGVLSFVGFGVFVSAIAAAGLTIVPFVILCGLYPGWLATQVEPSRALQYE